jgi:uncharacterized protein YrrD
MALVRIEKAPIQSDLPMSLNNVQNIDVLIGRSVLSVDTANKLGQVHDLIVHPTQGELVGLSVRTSDESHFLLNREEIHSIGPDAVMVRADESLLSPDQSQLEGFPFAKNNLIGVKVITEDGKLLGEIANVYVHLEEMRSLFIYEVRSYILDKLLGHGLYFPASSGCAFADDATRLVVTNETEKADHKLEAIASRLFSPSGTFNPHVSVRSVHNTSPLT